MPDEPQQPKPSEEYPPRPWPTPVRRPTPVKRPRLGKEQQ